MPFFSFPAFHQLRLLPNALWYQCRCHPGRSSAAAVRSAAACGLHCRDRGRLCRLRPSDMCAAGFVLADVDVEFEVDVLLGRSCLPLWLLAVLGNLAIQFCVTEK